MEIEYLAAHEAALTADARTIEARRLYHRLTKLDRLQRGLMSEGRRDSLARVAGIVRRQAG
jgi:hypothetical protein